MEDAPDIHPFERARLGKAPFKFIGYSHEVYQAIPGDPTCPIQPGSSRDYCGIGISDVYRVKSADGCVFKVGCDCIAKVSKECATTDAGRLAAEVRRAKRKVTNEKARVRKVAKMAELAELLESEDLRAKLACRPHPHPYRAALGETLLDAYKFRAAACGATSRARLLKELKAILAA